MKKIFSSTVMFALLFIFSHNGYAQNSDPRWDRWEAGMVKDSTYVQGSGVLEYFLYRVDANAGETNLMKQANFPDAYIIRLEELGFIVDYGSIRSGSNSGLSENVKRLMARHKANVSVTFIGQIGQNDNIYLRVIINIETSNLPKISSNIPNYDFVTFNVYQK